MYNESRLEADPRSSMNELSGVGTRVPRGILKNNGRNSGGDYGGPAEGVSPVPMGHNYMNMNQPHLVPHPSAYAHHPGPVNPPMNIHPSHSHVYPPDYGSHPMFNMQPGISQAYQHQVNPHATQWGLNYENRAPRSPTPPPSPESLCHQKLDTFVSSKRKSLFRQLAQEEKPLLESRLEERKSEGNYGVAPPIDYFLPLDASERVKEFMKSVQIGDIVIGEVDSSSPAGLVLILLCCDGGKRAYLEDLEIKGTCSPNQIVPPSDTADPNKSYEEEDYVRCEVLEINYESRKVGLGMKGANLSQEIRHAFPLGLISHEDLPVQYLLTRSEVKSRRRRSYEQILDDSAGFHNPNSIVCLGTSLGVFSLNHSLMAGLRGTFLKKDMANELRNAQNAKWAQYNVTLGIRHFKQGNQIEAFQCLNKAIIIDSQNVEGLVARGALYANNGSFDKAMEDFEAALKSNPDHFNGRKYMAETLVVVGKGQQDSGKGEEAINSYSKCLEMLPEHKESILSLMTLHSQIENLTITQLPSSALSKLLQVKDKLRSMIAAEIAKKKLRYYEKMDKNNGKDGSSSKKESTESSSSSGTSSDSDSSLSSNDDDSFRKGKKKKNKKRSKRKKRSKKNIKYSKDPSLSPFSRKLHANESTGSGLAGFSGTSYAEWGQQLGLVNKYPGHSDDDSQRSSRKSKDKKKSKKNKERRKKKKRSTSSSDSESPPQSKAAKKRDKGKVITDFGEIEEQLTAYFSKCEQGKPEARIPPQAVKITVEQSVDNNYNRFYDNSTRRIEVVPEPQKDLQPTQTHKRGSVPSAATGEAVPGITSGKIQLTDEFGNFQAQKIIRTVQNNQPEQTGRKFEMRFNVKPTTTSLVPTSVLDAAKNDLSHEKTNTGLPSSKWRTIGTAVEEPAYPANSSTSVELSQEELRDKITQESYSSSTLPVSSREPSFVPLEDKVKSVSNDEHGGRSRSYSSRKRSKSTSRSRSRSRSRSVSPRWRRDRHESKGRRRSRSRSHSIVRRSRSRSESRGRYRSRSRSRSFSPEPERRNFRFGQDYGGSQFQGRQPVRFFRGLHPAARRGSSRYHPQPSGGRDNGPSKFRNRFNRSRSRSPSYGRRSISLSPTRIRRSRSPNYAAKLHGPVPPRNRTSASARTPHRQTDAKAGPLEKSRIETSKHGGVEGEKSGSGNQNMLNKGSEHENTEMNVCGLKTKKIADVEELLDKHKAHKKEEMRENNPEFFRHP